MTRTRAANKPAGASKASEVSEEDALLDLIQRWPGLPIGEVRARMTLGWGRLYRIRDRLKEKDLIRVEEDGRRRRLYATGAKACDPRSTVMPVGGPSGRTARRIMRLVLTDPARLQDRS